MSTATGSTTSRGYGSGHQREREAWAPLVADGECWCAESICLVERDGDTRWLDPDQPWHLAHDRRSGTYLGPAHVRCITSEGGRHARHVVVRAVTL